MSDWHIPENKEDDWYHWTSGSPYTLYRCGFCYKPLPRNLPGPLAPCQEEECIAIMAMRTLASIGMKRNAEVHS